MENIVDEHLDMGNIRNKIDYFDIKLSESIENEDVTLYDNIMIEIHRFIYHICDSPLDENSLTDIFLYISKKDNLPLFFMMASTLRYRAVLRSATIFSREKTNKNHSYESIKKVFEILHK